MSAAVLQLAHAEANGGNGFVELLKRLREPGAQYSLKRSEMENMFKNKPLWKEQKTGSGHIAYKHQLTGVVVGWQAHGGSDLKEAQVIAIRDIVQTHLNTLHNDIFKFKSGGWKRPAPDFEQVSRKLRKESQANS